MIDTLAQPYQQEQYQPSYQYPDRQHLDEDVLAISGFLPLHHNIPNLLAGENHVGFLEVFPCSNASTQAFQVITVGQCGQFCRIQDVNIQKIGKRLELYIRTIRPNDGSRDDSGYAIDCRIFRRDLILQ